MDTKSISKLKKRADKEFSLFVRHRGAFYQEGELCNQCFTCGIVKPIKQLQAGHFIRRSVTKLRYDPINVQVQCYRCNISLVGNLYVYSLKLDQKFGEGTAALLYERSNEHHRFTAEELSAIIEESK